MNLVNYLMYDGNCERAIEFYQNKLGAEVLFKSYFNEMPASDDPNCQIPPGAEDKIMHATLKVGESELMMCDDPSGQSCSFTGFAISISVKSASLATEYFDALAQDGEISMPLTATFWSEAFGMLKDKFGVSWMISYDGGKMSAS